MDRLDNIPETKNLNIRQIGAFPDESGGEIITVHQICLGDRLTRSFNAEGEIINGKAELIAALDALDPVERRNLADALMKNDLSVFPGSEAHLYVPAPAILYITTNDYCIVEFSVQTPTQGKVLSQNASSHFDLKAFDEESDRFNYQKRNLSATLASPMFSGHIAFLRDQSCYYEGVFLFDKLIKTNHRIAPQFIFPLEILHLNRILPLSAFGEPIPSSILGYSD